MSNAAIASIAGIIKDYRGLNLDSAHVGRWASQFDSNVRSAILDETAHVLAQIYVSKFQATTFARGLARNSKLVGGDPVAFWRSSHLIRAGQNNRSQNDLIALSEAALAAEGLGPCSTLAGASQFVYLDDGIFTGNQLRYALKDWIENNNIHQKIVHVVVLGLHTGGWWYAQRALRSVTQPRGLTIEWWRILEIKSGVNEPKESQILWPTALPGAPPEALAWCSNNLGPNDFVPRPPNGSSSATFFSSETARENLEQEFFKQGCKLISLAHSPAQQMRPLGYTKLRTPGLGTMFATYRNCPNNAPLVMWWGDPSAGYPLNQWYPLLPRLM